jgi:hypothetical protein
LYDIAHITPQGLVILNRCTSDATFRDPLLSALQQMRHDAIHPTWLSDAIKKIQVSARTEPDLEI